MCLQQLAHGLVFRWVRPVQLNRPHKNRNVPIHGVQDGQLRTFNAASKGVSQIPRTKLILYPH